MKDEKRYKHRSYGIIQFSRCDGSPGRLFGSGIPSHRTFIRMTVKPAQLIHSLHYDRVSHSTLEPLIEVDLSAAQFAELITTLNYGAGVPCTIRVAADPEHTDRIEDPPEIGTEAERIQRDFQESLGGYVEKMQEYRSSIERLTDKLSGKAKEEIRIALDVITQQLASNVPFVVKQFNEAAERTVTAAKAEIEGFALHAVTTAGINALRETASNQLPEPAPMAVRCRFECKVCGEIPDGDGEITHSKGCYVVREDGGGTSTVDFPPRETWPST